MHMISWRNVLLLFGLLLFAMLSVGCVTRANQNDSPTTQAVELPMTSIPPVLEATQLPPTPTIDLLSPTPILLDDHPDFIVTTPQCTTPTANYGLVRNYTWSADGNHLSFNRNYAYLFALETGILEQIWPDLDTYINSFSPNAAQIVFSSYQHHNSTDIYLYDFQQDSLIELVNEPMGAVGPIWSPDGTEIAYRLSSRLTRQMPPTISELWFINVSTLEKTNLPLPEDIMDSFLHLISWSPDGEWLTFIARMGDEGEESHLLYLRSTNTGELRPLVPDHLCVTDPAWSPDAKQLAFSSDYDGAWNIYVVEIETGEVRRLTDGSSHNFQPSWSADGTQLLFLSVDTAVTYRGVTHGTVYQQQIWRMNADGTNLSLVVGTSREECCVEYPAWVPGQEKISFLVIDIKGCQSSFATRCPQYIELIDVDGSHRQRLLAIPEDD